MNAEKMVPRRRPLWNRRADYWRAAWIAIITVLATNVSQCAWNGATDSAKAHYWRQFGRGEAEAILHRTEPKR